MVGRQADHLQGRQVLARGARAATAPLFTGYTDNVTTIETPDADTVVVHTKQPDARIVGGLFIYILPKHVWGKVPVSDLTGSLPAEAAAGRQRPVHRHRVRARPDPDDGAQPELPGPEPKFDEIQFIKYGNQDAVERALQLGEIDMVPEVSGRRLRPARRAAQHRDAEGAPRPPTRSSTFNICSKQNCPDAKFNPAVQDRRSARRSPTRSTASGSTRSPTRGTSFPAHGILPPFYKSFYEEPAQDYPYDPEKANQMLDDAGWQGNGDGSAEKGGEKLSFDLYVRSESPVQHPGGQAGRRAGQGRSGSSSTSRSSASTSCTEITIRKVDGKPAPDFDTFIWGWGGDPVRPERPAQLLTTGEIGGSSDSFYSNPEYDRLFKQQSRRVRHRRAQGDDPADGRPLPARPAVPRPDLRPEPRGLPDGPAARTSSRSARRTDRRRHLRAGLL